jgi:tRNA(His) 5'-end guanylyltransferase
VPEDDVSEYMYNGRYQKMCSTLAALASSYFNTWLPDLIPEKFDCMPTFDCRAWQVPTLHDAYLTLLWRERDAIKNSISMVAQARFKHSALQHVGSIAKKEMLKEIGDPWEAYESCYRKGSYFKRVTEIRYLTESELAKIPEAHRNPNVLVARNPVKQVELEDLELLDEKNLFEIVLF